MAADILLYKPAVVPVGDDQTQHLEMARYIARRFNRKFGDVFLEPKPLYTEAPRVMSLTNPERKMSKSEPAGCLFLTDSPDIIREKIKRAVTATSPQKGVVSPGVKNLFLFLRTCGEPTVLNRFQSAEADGSIRYSELKTAVAEAIITELTPFQKKYTALMRKPKKLAALLKNGSKKAQKTARITFSQTKEKMGLTV